MERSIISLILSIIFFFVGCSKNIEDKIIGRWKALKGSSTYEFQEKGNVIMTETGGDVFIGRYKFVDDERIELSFERAKRTIILKISFDGDYLVLLDEADKSSTRHLNVSEMKYNAIYDFNDGLAMVELKNKFGFIDEKGKEVIKIVYDYAEDFYEGVTVVEKDGEYFVIDTKGEIVEEQPLTQKEFVTNQNLTAEIAMQYLYGSYDSQNKSSKWNTTKNNLNDYITQWANGNLVYSRIFLQKSIFENDVEKYILITNTNYDDNICHACGNIFGSFIFEKEKEGWYLISKNYYFTELGAWGEPPQCEFISIGVGKIGLNFMTGYSGQGYYIETSLIYPLYQNNFIEGITITTHEDNEGLGENLYSYNANFSFVKGDNPDYYDLVVKVTGTRYDYDSDRIISANETQKYNFVNGKYLNKKDIVF
ncbi:MAG: WG repeat-containing protein [Ignavibacteriales bacterium]|nr:WG repeat-containing protein [Ignavibacteriales bacterium]